MSPKVIIILVGAAILAAMPEVSLGQQVNAQRHPGPTETLGPADSLRGKLYCEKSQRLALHWANGDFEVWDTGSGRRIDSVHRLKSPMAWCESSPDGATIVTADRIDVGTGPEWDDREKTYVAPIRVWDAKTGRSKHEIRIPGVSAPNYYVHEWYPRWIDNSHALLVWVCRYNRSRFARWIRLIIVDVDAGAVLKASDDFERAGELLYLSPDRKWAVSKDDNSVRRKSRDSGLEIHWRNIKARTHVFDLERLTLASSWSEPRDPALSRFDVNAFSACWCPDGRTVLTVGDEHHWADDILTKVRLWDARRGRMLRSFPTHRDFVLDVALTSDGRKLVTASEDRTVGIWDTTDGKCLRILSGHTKGVNRVVVLPGDKLAVSGGEEPIAKVWDLAAGKLHTELGGHDSAVRDIRVLSADVVQTVSLRGTTATWNCLTGKLLGVIPPGRFGVCELFEEREMLRMRIVKPTTAPTTK